MRRWLTAHVSFDLLKHRFGKLLFREIGLVRVKWKVNATNRKLLTSSKLTSAVKSPTFQSKCVLCVKVPRGFAESKIIHLDKKVKRDHKNSGKLPCLWLHCQKYVNIKNVDKNRAKKYFSLGRIDLSWPTQKWVVSLEFNNLYLWVTMIDCLLLRNFDQKKH